MTERVAVKNAADEKQVKKAEKNDEFRREEEINDLITVLNTPEGRRVMWRILCECNVYSTVKRADGDLTHMAIGAQNIGHWLISEITEADAKLLFTMMQDNMDKEKEKQDGRRSETS